MNLFTLQASDIQNTSSSQVLTLPDKCSFKPGALASHTAFLDPRNETHGSWKINMLWWWRFFIRWYFYFIVSCFSDKNILTNIDKHPIHYPSVSCSHPIENSHSKKSIPKNQFPQIPWKDNAEIPRIPNSRCFFRLWIDNLGPQDAQCGLPEASLRSLCSLQCAGGYRGPSKRCRFKGFQWYVDWILEEYSWIWHIYI